MPRGGGTGFGATLRRMPGTQEVTVIHNEGQPDEERTTALCNVQTKKGFFEVNAQIFEGDVVELPDPRGGLRRLSVKEVEIVDAGPRASQMSHIAAAWGSAPQLRRAAIRRVGLENLHPDVIHAAGNLFTDEHYTAAIFEAFKAVEVRVRSMSGLDTSGQDLMAKAFDEKAPLIKVAIESGRSGEDEQRGFKFLFMGATVGIRNPKGHELVRQDDPQRAIEYLAFASVLMRRLDDASPPGS